MISPYHCITLSLYHLLEPSHYIKLPVIAWSKSVFSHAKKVLSGRREHLWRLWCLCGSFWIDGLGSWHSKWHFVWRCSQVDTRHQKKSCLLCKLCTHNDAAHISHLISVSLSWWVKVDRWSSEVKHLIKFHHKNRATKRFSQKLKFEAGTSEISSSLK